MKCLNCKIEMWARFTETGIYMPTYGKTIKNYRVCPKCGTCEPIQPTDPDNQPNHKTPTIDEKLETIYRYETELKDNPQMLKGFYLGVLGSTNDLEIRNYVEPRYAALPD